MTTAIKSEWSVVNGIGLKKKAIHLVTGLLVIIINYNLDSLFKVNGDETQTLCLNFCLLFYAKLIDMFWFYSSYTSCEHWGWTKPWCGVKFWHSNNCIIGILSSVLCKVGWKLEQNLFDLSSFNQNDVISAVIQLTEV